MNDRPLLADALQAPILGEHRPQHLVVIPPVAQERSAQDPFLHRANLSKGAVAAAVGDRRPSLEPLNADDVHREVQQQPRTLDEQARAPELRSQRKATLCPVERPALMSPFETPPARP